MVHDEVIDYYGETIINETSLSICSSATESKEDVEYDLYYIWRFKKRRANITNDSWKHSGQYLWALVLTYISIDSILLLQWGLCRYGIMYIIPYLTFNFLVISPIVMLDMAIGSISNYGLGKCFEIVPICIGLGWSMLCATVLYISSNTIVITTSVLYFMYTIAMDPPYWYCNNKYNTKKCTTKFVDGNLSSTSFSMIEFGTAVAQIDFQPKDNIIFDTIDYRKVIILFVLLLITFLLLLINKRIVTGIFKAFIISSLFYYLFLLFTIFNYDGSMAGLMNILKIDFQHLFEFYMWFDAMYYSFPSRLIGYGTVITYSSYNLVQNNVHRDSVVMIIFENAFSLLTAIVFAILKAIGSTNLNLPISCDDNYSIVYEYLVMLISFKNMWKGQGLVSLFLLAIFMITYPNLFAMIKSTYVAGTELLSIKRGSKMSVILKAGVCIFYFLISIIFTQRNTLALRNLFHSHTLDRTIPILILLETLVFTICYGSHNLHNAMLTTRKISWAWVYIVCVGLPIFFVLFIIMSALIRQPNLSPMKMTMYYMAGSIILSPILLGVLIQFIRYRAEYVTLSAKNVFKKMMIPQDYWLAEQKYVKRWKK